MTLSRRGFVGLCAGGAASLALGGGVHVFGGADNLVRPPVVLDDADFISKCLRCYRCVSVCPTRLVRRVFGKAAIEKKLPANPCEGSLTQVVRSDARVWVLVIALVSAFVVGFPVFCLVCPIGLTFGTVASIWRSVQFNDLTFAVLLFPAALVRTDKYRHPSGV